MSSSLSTVRYKCSGCDSTDACDDCVGKWLSVHGDTVMAEGRAWARRVTGRMPDDASGWPPWPDFDGSSRAREIADRLTRTFAGGDPRIQDRFARVCHSAAGEEYGKEMRLRSGQSDR